MLTTPENNVTFTDEQTSQLEEWKKRVMNLQDEVLLRERRIKEIKDESAKALRDREYHVDLAGEAQRRVALLKKEESDVSVTLANLKLEVEEQKKILKETIEDVAQKLGELRTKETAAEAVEERASVAQRKVEEKLTELKEEEARINKAKDILDVAVKSVWK